MRAGAQALLGLALAAALAGCGPPRIRLSWNKPPLLTLPAGATLGVDVVSDERPVTDQVVVGAIVDGLAGQRLNKWAAIPLVKAELEAQLRQAGLGAADPRGARLLLKATPLAWRFHVDKHFTEGTGRLEVKLEVFDAVRGSGAPTYQDTYWAKHGSGGGGEPEAMRRAARRIAQMFLETLGPTRVSALVELDDSDPVVENGIALCKQGLFDGGFDAFFAAVRARPDSAPALYDLAVMHEVKGNHDEAERLLTEATRLAQKALYYQALERVRRARADAEALETLDAASAPAPAPTP